MLFDCKSSNEFIIGPRVNPENYSHDCKSSPRESINLFYSTAKLPSLYDNLCCYMFTTRYFNDNFLVLNMHFEY